MQDQISIQSKRLDRYVALLDCIDDARTLLPPSPHSMSSQELRIATRLNMMENLTRWVILDERSSTVEGC